MYQADRNLYRLLQAGRHLMTTYSFSDMMDAVTRIKDSMLATITDLVRAVRGRLTRRQRQDKREEVPSPIKAKDPFGTPGWKSGSHKRLTSWPTTANVSSSGFWSISSNSSSHTRSYLTSTPR